MSETTTTATTTPPTPIEADEWFARIRETLKTAFQDITNIDVVTMVADDVAPPAKISKAEDLENVTIGGSSIRYYTKTTMQLNGGIYSILPAGTTSTGTDPQIREQVLRLHEQNVRTAVQNWNNLAAVVFKGIILVAELSGAKVPPRAYDLVLKMTAQPQLPQ
jgi:hypothetical protein